MDTWSSIEDRGDIHTQPKPTIACCPPHLHKPVTQLASWLDVMSTTTLGDMSGADCRHFEESKGSSSRYYKCKYSRAGRVRHVGINTPRGRQCRRVTEHIRNMQERVHVLNDAKTARHNRNRNSHHTSSQVKTAKPICWCKDLVYRQVEKPAGPFRSVDCMHGRAGK